jgi:uncharacterized protein YuzE
MMKLEYDPKVDALYVRFGAAPVAESEEVAPGIILDFDAERRIVALEILDARKNVAPDALTVAAE